MDVLERLELMTNYAIDEMGCCHYHCVFFVKDQLTRELLIALKEEFISKIGRRNDEDCSRNK